MEKEKSMRSDLGNTGAKGSKDATWRGRRFPTCVRGRVAVCCADERERARTGRRKSNRGETGGNGARGGTSGAVLSKLFRGVEREPVQVELCAVRLLFELLGFLLR